jgi:hypothetical protein
VSINLGKSKIDGGELHLDMNCNSKQYLALPNEDAILQGGGVRC